jgi:hypothetical protein
MRLAACLLAFCLSASAFKLDVTKVAAGATIFVDVLEAKTIISNARKAAKAAKKTAVKVVKKVTGR